MLELQHNVMEQLHPHLLQLCFRTLHAGLYCG
jgi:hypothetical protein